MGAPRFEMKDTKSPSLAQNFEGWFFNTTTSPPRYTQTLNPHFCPMYVRVAPYPFFVHVGIVPLWKSIQVLCHRPLRVVSRSRCLLFLRS